jgi:hypothetical protein
MIQQEKAVLNDVIDLIEEWQNAGRTGFCLPVIRDDLLAALEELADERKRDKCTICNSTGKIEYGDSCMHCRPLAGT